MKFVIVVELKSREFAFEYFNSLAEIADRVPLLKANEDVEALTVALILEEVRWN